MQLVPCTSVGETMQDVVAQLGQSQVGATAAPVLPSHSVAPELFVTVIERLPAGQVAAGLPVTVGVAVAVASDGVIVGVAVAVAGGATGVSVGLGEDVAVADAVPVGTPVGVSVAVGDAAMVAVAVPVGIPDGVAVGVPTI